VTSIYLDHQATSPADPRVVEAMLPWLSRPANPHAAHSFGREAAQAVERARAAIAGLVGCEPPQVVLTSGATEATNMAIRSLPQGARVLASAIEHPCVLETLASMSDRLFVTLLPVDGSGLVDSDTFAEQVRDHDVAVVMAVNNEIGTVQAVKEIADACRITGTAFMTDLTQAAGRIPIDLTAWDAAAAWLSSHKIYGPQGIGALVWRSEAKLAPLISGGGQQRGLRSGTIPTALAVGFGTACEIALTEMQRDSAHAAHLSQVMLAAIRARRPEVVVMGSMHERIPHNLSLAFPGVDADALVGSLPEVAISTGSACSAGALGTSHVLEAVAAGELASSTIRIGFGRATTVEEVADAARLICDSVDGLTVDVRRRVGDRA
jgi:cysteine desulfurase